MRDWDERHKQCCAETVLQEISGSGLHWQRSPGGTHPEKLVMRGGCRRQRARLLLWGRVRIGVEVARARLLENNPLGSTGRAPDSRGREEIGAGEKKI